MHPVWEKLAHAAEKDFDEKRVRKEARTLRIPILLGLLVVALAGYCWWANNIYPSTPGAYCDYPDPAGQ